MLFSGDPTTTASTYIPGIFTFLGSSEPLATIFST
ncbi:hypothetical protein B0H68_004898 [Clostridium beijerinckii]|nr:hypothetical protein [Clostridium beijerinckii]